MNCDCFFKSGRTARDRRLKARSAKRWRGVFARSAAICYNRSPTHGAWKVFVMPFTSPAFLRGVSICSCLCNYCVKIMIRLQVCNATPTNAISQYDCTCDPAGRRVEIARSGSAMSESRTGYYGYNERCELSFLTQSRGERGDRVCLRVRRDRQLADVLGSWYEQGATRVGACRCRSTDTVVGYETVSPR